MNSTAQMCMEFDGRTFDKERDGSRLRKQLTAVFDLMEDGEWRSLAQISEQTGFPEASVSARLRDLRKFKFGGHKVSRRHRQIAGLFGVWEYQLIIHGGF